MSRTWYIYCHTAPNGKRYIGQTCTKRPERRWSKGYKGCTYFERAIEKYGWDNIEHEVLAICHSREMADLLEKRLIARFDTTNPEHGYNILGGGRGRAGHPVSEETRQKISASLLGRKRECVSDEARKHMSESQKASYAKGNRKRFTEYSEETQARIRKQLLANSMANRHAVVQFDLNGHQLATYQSVAEAHRQTNTFRSNIINCCKGITHTANGFIWRYQDQPETFPSPAQGLSY